MEADTAITATEWDDVDKERIRQGSSGQENSRDPNNALEPQPDSIAMTSEPTVGPMKEKPFPFLRLPAEIRNMVYRYPQIYETKPPELESRGILYCDLQQPPITCVNRQIRYESLPIFYDIRVFRFNLDYLPEDDSDDAIDNQNDKVHYISNMLSAFIPGPSNTPQASNLRFLTCLSCSIQTRSGYMWGLAEVGFDMSSSPFDFVSDPNVELLGLVDTAGLDWDNTEDIKTAYVEGIDSSMLCQEVMEISGLPDIRCYRANDAVDEMARLMYLIAWLCPQLRSHVVATMDGNDMLWDTVWHTRDERMDAEESQ